MMIKKIAKKERYWLLGKCLFENECMFIVHLKMNYLNMIKFYNYETMT